MYQGIYVCKRKYISILPGVKGIHKAGFVHLHKKTCCQHENLNPKLPAELGTEYCSMRAGILPDAGGEKR